MSQKTYLPTDLQRRYRAILDEARTGEARVRDADGVTILLLLLEAEVQTLRRVAGAAANLAAVERVLDGLPDRQPEVAEFGEWSWLRAFDAEDLRQFVRDIREAIIVGAREGSTRLLDEQLRAWRVTAQQADDPLFRAILQGGASEEHFVEVRRPSMRTRGGRTKARSNPEDGSR